MNIIPINGFSQPKNVSSKGLTKCLKNRIFLDGQKDISVLLDKHPDNSCITGQLPRFMINKLPKENRKEAIAEIYAAFGKIVDGMEVVNKIAEVDTDYSDRPLKPQVIRSMTVETFGEEYPEPEKC